jgi:fatty-acid desaturase
LILKSRLKRWLFAFRLGFTQLTAFQNIERLGSMSQGLDKKFLFRNPLFYAQVLCHLSIIPMIIWGHWQHYLISFGVYFLSGCFGMSMVYHRYISHRSWPCPRWFEMLGTLFASLGLTGSSLAWCAVHRDHHAHVDKESDPHSPVHQPWWRVQFLSMVYRPKLRYLKPLLKDPFHVWMHRHYFYLQAVYVLILIAIDPFAVVYAYLFPAMILWNAGSSINTFGHLIGYRNYQLPDSSRNNVLLGFFMWGEGWHNNHHKNQKWWYFGRRWFEVDISGFIIAGFKALPAPLGRRAAAK